jgi:SNF2 family DNA or RNA helicase
MRFLSPQILGYKSFYSFARNHLEFSSEHPGVIVRTLRTDVLAAKINPYVYQVRKEECLNLPCKLYDERRFGMSREQKEAYDQAKWELLLGREDDEIITRHMLFRLFTALQQIISGFWHHTDTRLKINEHLEFNHVRLDVLESALDGMPDDAKVIIWCKYLYSVHAVSEMLLRLHGADAVAELHGQIPERRRGVEVERFRREARFLVATQSTGGHGLTLTEAHHVVFYENGFKYSDRIQAEDRCHRIGQDWPVTYVDLICHSSIDERIADTLQRKGNLVRDFKRRLDAIKDRAEADRIIKGL